MKFGVFYEIQLPFPHREGDENQRFREALEHVELADRLGIHYMWGVEHHFLEDHALSSAPEVWLAAAAARTSQIRIGHGIACMPPGFTHPAHIAEFQPLAHRCRQSARTHWRRHPGGTRASLTDPN